MNLLKGTNNSLGLSFGRKWENTKQYLLPFGLAPGSSVSIVGEVLTCTSVVGESSKASRFVNVKPGEIVTFQVTARLTSGVSGSIGIDYPTAGALQAKKTITNTEWDVHEVSFIVPLTAGEDTNCVLQSGIFGSDDGTVEYILPKVTKGNCQVGSTQSLALGQIFFDTTDSNAPKINPGFCSHGIYALSYDTPSKELSITIDQTKRDDPEGAEDVTGSLVIPVRPLFFGNVAFDNGGAGLSVQFSGYTYSTGVLKAQFFDASGTLIDIATVLGGGNIFFTFEAKVN